MQAALKAEFRKLLTVRSTYVIVGLSLLLIAFAAFYAEGFRGGGSVGNPNKLAGGIVDGIIGFSLLGALVGVLLMTHEYRYNTIMYTLTSSNSRSRTLLAKITAVSVFAIVFTVAVGLLMPLMTYLGVEAKGLTMVPQHIALGDLLWRSLFYGWGLAMLAFILATTLRSQIGAIVALFFIPATVEPLLGLLFKHNIVYLPFNALGSVLGAPPANVHFPHGRAALVFCIYLVVGWAITWWLFLRRDAN